MGLRHEDWPERLARYVRARPDGIGDQEWVDGWLAECGGTMGDEIDRRLAQRGYLVEFAGGMMAICVGQYAAPAAGPMQLMGDALRAWRVV
ncbi:MAG: hypothetical protein AB7N70_13870 [Dehalococcoidia bacterium]